MLKPVFQLAAVGVLGFAAWKLFSFLLVPLFGTLLGLVFLVVKVALIVAVVYLVWRWLKKEKGGEATSEPAD